MKIHSSGITMNHYPATADTRQTPCNTKNKVSLTELNHLMEYATKTTEPSMIARLKQDIENHTYVFNMDNLCEQLLIADFCSDDIS